VEPEVEDVDHMDDNEITHPAVLVKSPRKGSLLIDVNLPQLGRDRSISHTFGYADLFA
jgi:hypothetical protein